MKVALNFRLSRAFVPLAFPYLSINYLTFTIKYEYRYSLRIMWSTFAIGFSWAGTWWCYARWCRYINAWRSTVKSTLRWFGWDCRQPKYLKMQTKNSFTLFDPTQMKKTLAKLTTNNRSFIFLRWIAAQWRYAELSHINLPFLFFKYLKII